MKLGTWESVSKSYYVFVGQNATMGTPNANTGLMSNYGSVYCFRSKEKAKHFADNYNHPREFAKAGSARSIRKFCLGLSVRDYLYSLEILDYMDNEV